MNVVLALHGFLGVPRDFAQLAELFEAKKNSYLLVPVDYMNIRGLTTDVPFDRWGENFNLWANKNYPKVKKVILGYSQGGRLALHALRQNPNFWQGSVFLSTNPGMKIESEKGQRKENDLKWAQRFQNVDFETVVREWNAQAIFVNSKNEPRRVATDYDSQVLSKALTQWSLANQKDFRQEPAIFSRPSLWMAGQNDAKYVEIVRELEGLNRNLNSTVVEGASHRLFLDAPELTALLLDRFVRSLQL